MRPVDRARAEVGPDYVRLLAALAAGHGITHTGVGPATVMQRARDELHRRRGLGLHDGMQFTYRAPDRSTDPSAAVRGARAVFVGAMPYWLPDEPAPTGPAGAVARYAWRDHYAALRDGLWAVARQLRDDGYKAVAFADDNSVVDREAAHRAGIGWFGKNANLLVPGAGSWFVLGSVITDAPLPVATDPVPDGCGACVRCMDRCPTGAIVQPGVVDAARCLAWVLQKPGIIPASMRAAVGNRIYGCDDCQTACPPTVRFSGRAATSSSATASATTVTTTTGASSGGPGGAAAPLQAWVPLIELLDATDHDLLTRWGRWYVADRDPRWVRRNALVVLGNVGDSADPGVSRVLAAHVTHPDPVLRVHAIWAARRLGLHHLVPADDHHPDVLAELAEAAAAAR